jgi:hypothetical protein
VSAAPRTAPRRARDVMADPKLQPDAKKLPRIPGHSHGDHERDGVSTHDAQVRSEQLEEPRSRRTTGHAAATSAAGLRAGRPARHRRGVPGRRRAGAAREAAALGEAAAAGRDDADVQTHEAAHQAAHPAAPPAAHPAHQATSAAGRQADTHTHCSDDGRGAPAPAPQSAQALPVTEQRSDACEHLGVLR